MDLSGSELAVSLGGDGTFLRLAASAWAAGVPVLGVNFGRLGYLPEVQPHALFPALERTLAGDASVEERTALWVTVAAGGPTDASPGAGGPWLALNEVVLEKTVFGHTVRLAAAIDGDPFITYSADGLLGRDAHRVHRVQLVGRRTGVVPAPAGDGGDARRAAPLARPQSGAPSRPGPDDRRHGGPAGGTGHRRSGGGSAPSGIGGDVSDRAAPGAHLHAR